MRRFAFAFLAGLTSAVPAFTQAPRSAPVQPAAPSRPIASPAAPTQNAPVLKAGKEHLRTFDSAKIRLVVVDSHWEMAAGDQVLKDFGPHEKEARQAVQVIQQLHVNQYGVIGSPAPVLEYWLKDGEAPHPPAGLLRSIPLSVSTLRVEQIRGQWYLRDANKVFFNFGSQVEDARQALAIVQKYHFTNVSSIGPGGTPMFVFTNMDPRNQPHAPDRTHPAEVVPPPQEAKPKPKPAKAPDRWKPPVFDARGNLITEPEPTAIRVPFDWRRAEIRREKGEWKLASGSQVLATFGANEFEARHALTALQHYRFSEQWCAGSEKNAFRYFLANGQSPRGVMLGLAGKPFDPDTLELKKVENHFALFAGPDPLIHLGSNPEEGKQLLSVIRKNQFDRLCNVGEPGQGITFLIKSR
jgi:hypothetical protein